MTLYGFSVAMSDIVNNNSDWVRVNVLEGSITPAAWASLDAPEERAHFISTANDQKRWVYNTGRQGAGDIDYDWDNKVRWLWLVAFMGEALVTLDPEIKTIADLEGKRVVYGSNPNTEFDWFIFRMFEHAGFTVDDLAAFEYMSFTPAVDAIRDGLIDACIGSVMMQSLDPLEFGASPFTVELRETADVYNISFELEPLCEAAEEIGSYVPFVVPANTYEHQPEDWLIVGKYLLWCADLDLPDEVVTEISTHLYNNADQIKDYLPPGKIFTQETMVAIDKPEREFHPALWEFTQEHDLHTGNILELFPAGRDLLRECP
jgi:TRAP-type uncharacterized transport system substrate-binding protein